MDLSTPERDGVTILDEDFANRLLFTLGDYHIVETDGGGLLEARGDMGIGVKCHLYAGMAEALLEYLRVNPLLQHD